MGALKKTVVGVEWLLGSVLAVTVLLYLSFPYWTAYLINQSLVAQGMQGIKVDEELPAQ